MSESEHLPDSTRPTRDPGAATTSDEFVRALASLRVAAGESYRALHQRTGIPLSTLNDTLSGRRKPRNPVIRQVVQAYADDDAQAAAWLENWAVLMVDESRPADPAGSADAADPARSGTSAPLTGAMPVLPASTIAPSDTPNARKTRSRLWIVAAVAAAVVVLGAGLVWQIGLAGDEPGDPGPDAGPDAAAVLDRGTELTVFNVEEPCRDQRIAACALGLYRSPWEPRSADNQTGRVFHEDVVVADCVIADGRLITDETGVSTHRWYHVAVPGSDVVGWLPAVRTRTDVEVAACRASRPTTS
ncbi:helix-turn-helix domain-containing protein [Kineosporia succinea]|uniref:Transcriptional regulator with XRE-family HTH domain n=1 Tax=Kineosporia succinea TaxID=84632 RepID=A0ABT9P923_9ACTN|nr:helix-turn-helix domain-containing protein [Kineosporia succinea]MDP9828914.1 transcriptional regulator with XRE-family HTH domain [Kineosporia succinea]